MYRPCECCAMTNNSQQPTKTGYHSYFSSMRLWNSVFTRKRSLYRFGCCNCRRRRERRRSIIGSFAILSGWLANSECNRCREKFSIPRIRTYSCIAMDIVQIDCKQQKMEIILSWHPFIIAFFAHKLRFRPLAAGPVAVWVFPHLSHFRWKTLMC